VQFDSRKFSRRRFSRGSCAANSPLSVPREVEKRDAFVQIGFVGVLVPLDLAPPPMYSPPASLYPDGNVRATALERYVNPPLRFNNR
jgi:hypothetical protein